MMLKLGQELECGQIKVKVKFFLKQIFLKYFQEMIKAADLDRDGKISWDEFKKFMQSPN